MKAKEEKLNTSDWMYLDFEPACLQWLETRRNHISPKTAHEYRLIIKTLSRFFGAIKLSEITADLIRQYQRERTQRGCGASTINHETSALQQILKRIGRWGAIGGDFSPLPLPKWQPGRVLFREEKDRLLRVALSNPELGGAAYFAIISVKTSAGPHEVATLRLMDVNLEERVAMVQPEGAKRPERVRPLHLNDSALAAMKLALQRAFELGCKQPGDYIFPYRHPITKVYVPTRFQRTFRWGWAKLVKAAGLDGLHMYDLRRTAITDLLQDPESSEETVRQIAGHVSRHMLKFYSYRRMDTVRGALDRLDKPREKKVVAF